MYHPRATRWRNVHALKNDPKQNVVKRTKQPDEAEIAYLFCVLFAHIDRAHVTER